jgi:hypothetical protein
VQFTLSNMISDRTVMDTAWLINHFIPPMDILSTHWGFDVLNPRYSPLSCMSPRMIGFRPVHWWREAGSRCA